MKNHLVVVGIAVLLIFVGLSGCINETGERSKFFGTWISEDGYFIYTFYSDGTGKFTGYYDENKSAIWEIGDGKLTIISDDGHNININAYYFSNDDKMLTIAGKNFIKQ